MGKNITFKIGSITKALICFILLFTMNDLKAQIYFTEYAGKWYWCEYISATNTTINPNDNGITDGELKLKSAAEFDIFCEMIGGLGEVVIYGTSPTTSGNGELIVNDYIDVVLIYGNGGDTFDGTGGTQISKTDLGSSDLLNQLKNTLQDMYCIYLGQAQGSIVAKYTAGDFFNYANMNTYFTHIGGPLWPVYSYTDNNYKIVIEENSNAEFSTLYKFYPANSGSNQYTDANGVVTTDYSGNPIPFPYAIRISGWANWQQMNIATIYFKTQEAQNNWWDYMHAKANSGSCGSNYVGY